MPDHFIRGLSSASLQGRAQIVPDSQANSEEKDKDCSLVFYLDGAHSPESMEICAKWFSHATKDDRRLTSSVEQSQTSRSQKVLSHGISAFFHASTCFCVRYILQ